MVVALALWSSPTRAEEPATPEAAAQGAGRRFDLAIQKIGSKTAVEDETDADGFVLLPLKPGARRSAELSAPAATRRRAFSFEDAINKLTLQPKHPKDKYVAFWSQAGETLGPAGGTVFGWKNFGLPGAVSFGLLGRMIGPWVYGEGVGGTIRDLDEAGLIRKR